MATMTHSTSSKKVKEVLGKTFGVIRSAVADQMELYCESFYLMPMLRRLEGDMALMELEESDRRRYRARCDKLKKEREVTNSILVDLKWCAEEVQKFRVTRGG